MSEITRSTAPRLHDRRPWGEYVVLEDADDHKVKRIVVLPGQRISLQRHQKRMEHWHFIAGSGVATVAEAHIPVATGDSVDIPQQAIHRVENTGDDPLVFIEVQRGDYFGEDDIERFEDDYGRG